MVKKKKGMQTHPIVQYEICKVQLMQVESPYEKSLFLATAALVLLGPSPHPAFAVVDSAMITYACVLYMFY